MNQPTLLSAIARWVVSADFPDLPDGEIAAARAALADFVAVAAAGSGTSVVRNAALYAAQNERAGCSSFAREFPLPSFLPGTPVC